MNDFSFEKIMREFEDGMIIGLIKKAMPEISEKNFIVRLFEAFSRHGVSCLTVIAVILEVTNGGKEYDTIFGQEL